MPTMPSGSKIRLNPILTFTSPVKPQSDSCHVYWDLRDPPGAATTLVQDPVSITSSRNIRVHRCHLAYQHASSDDATNPPVSRFQIICELLSFRWPIEARNDQGVKVHDVIEAIYKVAQVPLRPDEWERMTDKDKDRIQAAYKLRWMSAVHPETERLQGVRRVDCLLHYTRFGGLSFSFDRSHRCVLTLSRQSPHPGTGGNTSNESLPSSNYPREPSRRTNRLKKNRRKETPSVEIKEPHIFLTTAGYSTGSRPMTSTSARAESLGRGPRGSFASFASYVPTT